MLWLCPSSIEQIVRSFPEVVEYRLAAYKAGALDALTLEIKDRLDQPERVAQELRLRLGLQVEVRSVRALGLAAPLRRQGAAFRRSAVTSIMRSLCRRR